MAYKVSMNWFLKHTQSFTSQRNFDRTDLRDSDVEPLTEQERKRLDALVRKVDMAGTPSVLSDRELEEYERLGTRSNMLDAQFETTSLPTAIRPWITQ